MSWDALIDRYAAFIFTVARRMGATEVDAEDVFQNVCVTLFQNLGTLKESSRLSSWLGACTRQEVWRLGRRRRVPTVSEVSDGETEVNMTPVLQAPERGLPEEELLALERQRVIRESLDRLGTPCGDLLRLLYSADSDLSYAEIAARLSMPVGSIGPRRARCLEQLEKMLQESGF